jgi:phytoene/squalene synthetase
MNHSTLTDPVLIFHTIDFEGIKRHPNILVAASFWDQERFEAAQVCYKFMRKVDDLVDDYKSVHMRMGDDSRERLTARVEEWRSIIRKGRHKSLAARELLRTIDRFRIPLWPFEDFADSMIYDIRNDGFPTVQAFLDYSKGATVAPSSVFVHLCGLRKNGTLFEEPLFDVRKAATPCALFSYLVHIIRDFQKDQQSHLNYFADDAMLRHGLTREMLSGMADGAEITGGFREMIREYYLLADEYRRQTLEVIKTISPLLEPRHVISLNIIFNLYLLVFERIDPDRGSFTASELNPSPAEIKQRVWETINRT